MAFSPETKAEQVERVSTKLLKITEQLQECLQERDPHVTAIIYGLMTGRHVIFFGPTGSAKSQLVRLAYSRIRNAKVFKTQCFQGMTRENLFGPISVRKMREEDSYEHAITDSLADCDLALLDEWNDASVGIRRSALTVFNEREFLNHKQRVQVPLHSVVASTNFWKDDEESQAITDRFLLRVYTPWIRDRDARIRMYQNFLQYGTKLPLKTTIKMGSLKFIKRYIQNDLAVDPRILSMYDDMITELRETHQVVIPDRRLNEALVLAGAEAALRYSERSEEERGCILPQDLIATRWGLIKVQDREQEKAFADAFSNHIKDLSISDSDDMETGEELMVIQSKLQSARTTWGGASRKSKRLYERCASRIVALAEEVRQVKEQGVTEQRDADRLDEICQEARDFASELNDWEKSRASRSGEESKPSNPMFDPDTPPNVKPSVENDDDDIPF